MKKQTLHLIRLVGVCVFGLVMLVLVSACAGVTQNANGTITANIVGQVQSVDASKHSVTLNVNGQLITVNGLTDQQIAALQSQVGKTYSIHTTQSTDGSYNINSGTDPQENDNATPGVEQTEVPGAPELGSISFTGTVKSVSNSNIQVSMPDGKVLSMNIVNGQTDLGENGTLPTVGQLIKVKAITNSDGSFMAKSLKVADSNDMQDQNVVEYQGVTTSAVGSDGVIHFKVGNDNYSYTINASTTQVKDFPNAQAIGANQPVKVKVQFNGSTAVVLQVQNSNG
jgi:hypothetical protein